MTDKKHKKALTTKESMNSKPLDNTRLELSNQLIENSKFQIPINVPQDTEDFKDETPETTKIPKGSYKINQLIVQIICEMANSSDYVLKLVEVFNIFEISRLEQAYIFAIIKKIKWSEYPDSKQRISLLNAITIFVKVRFMGISFKNRTKEMKILIYVTYARKII